MRRAILILVLALAPMMGRAQDGPATDIQTVIERQMEAFSTRNVVVAWGFAAPTIQDIFQTPFYFGAMVERSFPMVWDPGEVSFLGLSERNGRPVQRVQVIDRAGRLHLLDYEMTSVDGNWRISAVEILRAPGVGA